MGEEEKVFNGLMSAATKLVAEQWGMSRISSIR